MSYQHLEITKNLLLNDLPEYYILYVIMNLYDYIYLYIDFNVSIVRKYCFET